MTLYVPGTKRTELCKHRGGACIRCEPSMFDAEKLAAWEAFFAARAKRYESSDWIHVGGGVWRNWKTGDRIQVVSTRRQPR